MISPDARGMHTRRNIRNTICHILPSALLLVAPVHAWGQDIAAAEALFNKGVAELKAGNYKEACPAIAQSQKLDPRPGTQFTLAECLARSGKTASAYVAFEDFLRNVQALPVGQQGRYADRIKVAEGKKAELKPNIPELTIVLPSNAPSDVKITRDGTEITGPMIGLSLPVDPGEHKVVVEVLGKPPSQEKFTLSPGEHRTLEVTIPGMKTAKADEPLPSEEPGKPGMGRTIGTYAALGIGAAGLIMGGVTGGLALSNKQSADEQCPKFACTPQGLEAVEHGRTMARISTIGFAIGGAGIAAGVILFLTRPKPDKPPAISADVAINHTGFVLGLKGVWGEGRRRRPEAPNVKLGVLE
jgi:hypothetical protein